MRMISVSYGGPYTASYRWPRPLECPREEGDRWPIGCGAGSRVSSARRPEESCLKTPSLASEIGTGPRPLAG